MEAAGWKEQIIFWGAGPYVDPKKQESNLYNHILQNPVGYGSACAAHGCGAYEVDSGIGEGWARALA